jgi:hypothetical protein
MLIDRLFLNGMECDLSPSTVIALNFQINDLAELKDRQGNFSNQFKIPMTANNRAILEDAELLQSGTDRPYRKLPARVSKNNIDVVPIGFAIVESSEKTYNVTVFSGITYFFSLIANKQLHELDLSAYDHIFNWANIIASRSNTDGYKYSLIYYGQPVMGDVKNLRPLFFIQTLIDKIFSEAGFTKTGNIWSDSNYQKQLLSLFNESDIEGFYDYESRWSHNNWLHDIPSAVPPTPLTLPISYFIGASGEEWTCRLRIRFDTPSWNTGTSYLKIYAYAHSTDFFGSSTFNLMWTSPAALGVGIHDVDVSVNIAALPDTQFIEFYIEGNDTGLGHPAYFGWIEGKRSTDAYNVFKVGIKYDAVAQGFFPLQPYRSIVIGTYKKDSLEYDADEVVIARQLQDLMTQKDLIKIVANQHGLFFKQDPYVNNVKAFSIKDIVNNIPYAVDWTDKLHMDKDTWKVEYRFGKYGKKNYMKYTRDDDDIETISYKTLGQGVFTIDDETLDDEVTIIQLPVAASKDIQLVTDPKYWFPRVYKKDDSGTLFKRANVARVLEDDTRTLPGIDTWHFSDGTNNLVTAVDIPFCYFQLNGQRLFNLGFDDSLLINYEGLIELLQKAKKFTAFYKLTEIDIQNLNQEIPVYLTQLSSYYYQNKVLNYTGYAGANKGLTKVELIKI